MNRIWPEAAQKWKEALGRYQYALLVIAVGVVLLLLPVGGRDGAAGPASSSCWSACLLPVGGRDGAEEAVPAQTEGTAFDLEAFEEKLARTLSQVEGAGQAQVVLTLDGGSRQVLARNQDREGDGGVSNTVVTVGKGSGQQEAVPIQTVAPQFRGALVVCPGGGDAQVRLKLIEAVSALTGLGADKISVCQGG